jgi:hypothetical protein
VWLFRPCRQGADQACGANLAEIGVDLDLREDRSVRLQCALADGRRIARALAPSVDLPEPGAGDDFGIAPAAALVVAAVKPPGARDDPRFPAPKSGEPRSAVASSASRATALRPAASMAEPAVAVWADPPATLPLGRREPPNRNVTRPMSSPSLSAAICASTVKTPCRPPKRTRDTSERP